jgi:hypothetical protein
MLDYALRCGAFFVGEIMNQLLESAQSFLQLCDYEYHYIIGRKGQTKQIILGFSPEDFHHLAGLHKIRDNDFLRTAKRQKVFNSILDGEITDEVLASSQYYTEIQDRIALVSKLETLLESSELIFRFSDRKLPFYSRIDADYLLECKLENTVYVFLIACSEENHYRCKSLFYKRTYDYTNGQERYTLLKTVKRNPNTMEETVLYCRPGFEAPEAKMD